MPHLEDQLLALNGLRQVETTTILNPTACTDQPNALPSECGQRNPFVHWHVQDDVVTFTLQWIVSFVDLALCGGVPSPFMRKSQYRMSMVYPIPEATGNLAIGASTTTWGVGHAYPGPGDAHLYLLWEWKYCCLLVIQTMGFGAIKP